MSALPYVTLDVFTDTQFGGNQLAVFPDASAIPEGRLLQIAQEFNYSETTFCYPPTTPGNAARVRIFTPTYEMPFAGHPTVGTAIALVTGGKVPAHASGTTRLVLEEGVGPIPVTVTTPHGAPASATFAVAKLAEIGPQPIARGLLAEMLSLSSSDFAQAPFDPQAISCGLPFLLVPLASVEALGRARVRLDRFDAVLKGAWAQDVFLFAPAEGPGSYRARMFAPALNIIEDPATGSACACLAGYLAHRTPGANGTLAWTVMQGVEMGRPSRIEIGADVQDGQLTAIRVGGRAVPVCEGVFQLDA